MTHDNTAETADGAQTATKTRTAEQCPTDGCTGTRREHTGSGTIEDCTGSCGYEVTSDRPFHLF